MKNNSRKRVSISQIQLDRVVIVLTHQWEEVIRIVQSRANQNQEERRLLLHQAMQQYQTHRDAV